MDKTYLELCDFNAVIYRKNSDLQSLSKSELEDHFLKYGIDEGRTYNFILNRKAFLNRISKEGKMLEIGPLDNPQLDHHSPKYYSLDVFSKDQLVQNYITDPNVIKEKIIEPSYVITNNDYSTIKEKFECIFSSHSIEHMPCVVTFLKNLQGMLSIDGYVYLIIPDKRYCFDHFKRETDIYDVLQLYYEKNSRPRFFDILKMASQITHNDPVAHWHNDHGMIRSDAALLQNYQRVLDQYNSGHYIDSHVSFFTPENFMHIINLLNKLKLIKLKIHKMYHTLENALEFYVILKLEEEQ